MQTKFNVTNKSSLIKKIKTVLSKKKNILAIYLYGSQARGKTTPRSDVDLAVLLSHQKEKNFFEQGLNFRLELEKSLGSEVDVVILNNADPFLGFQVYANGLPVFLRNKKEAELFKWRCIRNYWDYLPIKHIMEDAAINRLHKY